MMYKSRIVLISCAMFFAPAAVFAGNASNGNVVFQEKCAACHGKDGTAVLPGAPSFSKGERMEKSDSSLKASITNGLNAMPPFKGVLSDGQLGDLMSYVRTLKK